MRTKIIRILLLVNISLGCLGYSISLSQSSPDLNWREMDQGLFRIIYPDYVEADALKALGYLKFYHELEIKDFDVKLKKFNLIIRPEMATQNGFVTLMPSRSEWFSSETISPFIGGLDWLQALAVHEYRHHLQFSKLEGRGFRVGKFLFGDAGVAFLIFWTTHSWFFEGDAVWAETVYTNAGRGRSPRFVARAKALIQSGNFPTLDQLLAPNYVTDLPNHYVWGYLLTARARQVYGRNIWDEILRDVTTRVYNPFAIYASFKKKTGKNFNDFYAETIEELKKEWGTNSKKDNQSDYTEISYPHLSDNKIYYFKSDLDSHTALYERKIKDTGDLGAEVKIKELNIDTVDSKVSIKNNKVAYVYVNGSARFAFKEYSNLYIYDIKRGTNTKVSDDKRYYHPDFNEDASKILVTEFSSDNTWRLCVLDAEGRFVEKIETQRKVYEGIWAYKGMAYIDANDLGYKRVIYRHENGSEEIVIDETRNNIFNLRADKQSIYFEADYDGKVNIFSYDLNTKKLTQKTNAKIAAYNGAFLKEKVIFTEERAEGRSLRIQKSHDQFIEREQLQKRYLSQNDSSDKYFKEALNEADPQIIKDSEIPSKNYNEYKELLIPHSWSFIGGRGYKLDGTFNNSIGSIGTNLVVGEDAIEQRPYGEVTLNYYKFYPIIGLRMSYQERNTEEDDIEFEWKQKGYGAFVLVPYLKSIGHYQIVSFIGAEYAKYTYSETKVEDIKVADDDISLAATFFHFGYLKNPKRRSINPEYGVETDLYYSNANKKIYTDKYLFRSNSSIYLPGITNHHSIAIGHSYLKQPRSYLDVKITEEGSSPDFYLYSRGYNQSFYTSFSKLTFDYSFPIAYLPGVRLLGDWLSFSRLRGNLFYDETKLKQRSIDSLTSYGADLIFDMNLFRKIPITLLYRKLYKKTYGEQESEIIFGVNGQL